MRLEHPSRGLSAALVLGFVAGCAPGAAKPDRRNDTVESTGRAKATAASVIQLIEMTDRSGVRFTYRNGQEAQRLSILETVGGGVGLLDFDSDGRLDLFFTGGGGFGPHEQLFGAPPGLFRQIAKWRFQPVARDALVEAAPAYTHGCAVADYDGDGFPDLLITGYGRVLLYRNSGDGTFSEQAERAGLGDRLWGTSAGWGDVNRDGHPDLYVVQYVDWSFENDPECRGAGPAGREVCSPLRFGGLPDALYLSNGDGTFRNASAECGLRLDGKGLGVLLADVDLDGAIDIYVANDTTPNFLYHNDGSGRFEEIGLLTATALDDQAAPNGSMGVDLGDFNLDGLPDLWVANFENESFALYRNQGNLLFTHVSRPLGIADVGGVYVGWGTAFADLDRDGDEDVISSNGHVMRFPVNAPVRQTPLLFENRRDQGFVDVARGAGEYLASAHEGRGLAVGDIDSDGDLDVAISRINEPAVLLSNESHVPHHWLGLRLVGTVSSRDAVGAIVHLRSAAGTQIRQVKGGGSYLSSSDRTVFFGLGEDQEIEELEIRWPSGHSQMIRRPDADRVITVVELRHRPL